MAENNRYRLQKENARLCEALEKIASGAFPGYLAMAAAGNWRGIAAMFQQIASMALEDPE